jgi:hypothetical protein
MKGSYDFSPYGVMLVEGLVEVLGDGAIDTEADGLGELDGFTLFVVVGLITFVLLLLPKSLHPPKARNNKISTIIARTIPTHAYEGPLRSTITSPFSSLSSSFMAFLLYLFPRSV